MNTKEMLTVAVKALDEKKAMDIKVMEIGDLTIVAEDFVIATGTSTTHVKALADEVEYALSQKGVEPDHIEGKLTGWIVLDYETVVVHVFLGESREYYNLERLWTDAKEIDIKDLIGNGENE